jgi:hypothetical protein
VVAVITMSFAACDATVIDTAPRPSASSGVPATPTAVTSPRTWDVSVVGDNGAEMPVAVVDYTGLISGALTGRVRSADVVGRSAAVEQDDAERRLSIEWTANPCDTATTFSVSLTESVLSVAVDLTGGFGCDDLGATYRIDLGMSAPLGDDAIVVAQSDTDARSWGFQIPASDGTSRRALVLDRSARVAAVRPVDPATLDVAEDGVSVLPGHADGRLLVSWRGDVCDDSVDVVVDDAAALTIIEVTLANRTQGACVGESRVEGIEIEFTVPVQPDAVAPRLVTRH